MEEIKLEQSVNSQLKDNKNNSFLVMLLSILLLISVFIAGFFAWKTQQLVSKIRVMSNESKPTPIATATPTPDPTVDWETYTNSKFNFTFKYPKPISELKEFNKYTNDLISIYGLDSLIIQIEPVNITNGNVQNWWNNLKIDPISEKPTSCFTQKTITSINSLYDNKLEIIKFDKEVTMFDNLLGENKTGICPEPQTSRIIILDTGKSYIRITYTWAEEAEKILSTFKFIEPVASSSPLPAACTMDAKICPDGSAVGRSGPKCEFAACPTPKS